MFDDRRTNNVSKNVLVTESICNARPIIRTRIHSHW